MDCAAEGMPHVRNASLCPFLAQIPRLVIHIQKEEASHVTESLCLLVQGKENRG